MQIPLLFQTFVAFATLAPQTQALPADEATAAKRAPAVAPSGSAGYAFIGSIGATQYTSNVFNPTVASQNFAQGTALNPSCASYCRSQNTQYYSVIDYLGQCSCGNVVASNMNYSTSSPGCQLCGGNFRDEGYVTGPGVCGDYYYGVAALYSLVF